MKRSRKFLLVQRLHGMAFKIWKNMSIEVWGIIASLIISSFALYYSKQANTYSKRSFEVQNMPFLQVGNFKLINKLFHYSISNLNQYPAKIIYVYQGFAKENNFDNNKNWIRIFDNRQVFRPPRNRAASNLENVYVIKDDSVSTIQYDPLFDLIKEDDLFFFGGQIYYVDQITDKIRVYQFVLQLSGKNNDLNRIFIENENKFFDNEKTPRDVKPNGSFLSADLFFASLFFAKSYGAKKKEVRV